MWLKTPDTITSILIERPLNIAGNEPHRQDGNFRGSSNDDEADRASGEWESVRDMPIVTIGQPESWALQNLYPPRKLPRSIRVKLDQADFYVVRFSCSFRPVDEESRIDSARFRIILLPLPHSFTTTRDRPIAFDLYPQQVVQEVKRQVKVTLNPQLKFHELEVSTGSIDFGIEDTEQIPLISGTLGTSYDPSWSYKARLKGKLQGTRWMYLLVKAPLGMMSAHALLDLEAKVQVRGTLVAAKLWRQGEPATAQVKAVLWDKQTHPQSPHNP